MTTNVTPAPHYVYSTNCTLCNTNTKLCNTTPTLDDAQRVERERVLMRAKELAVEMFREHTRLFDGTTVTATSGLGRDEKTR